MTALQLIQMSGVPGSGKTTIATAIAKATGAVILDHDISKSALLGADIPVAMAGPGSYEVIKALAHHLLEQGHSVIIDSPCRYQTLLDWGLNLAQEFGASYRYVECRLDDLTALDQRLRTRQNHPSQVTGVFAPPSPGSGKTETGEAIFKDWIANMKRPQGDYLLVDTNRPTEICIAEALRYVQT